MAEFLPLAITRYPLLPCNAANAEFLKEKIQFLCTHSFDFDVWFGFVRLIFDHTVFGQV
jgi:hypothetical protein